MKGLRVGGTLVPTTPRACRFTGELVTGFYYGTGLEVTLVEVQSVIPVPAGMDAVPSQLPGLLCEFFLLDPTNATMIAEKLFPPPDPALIEQLAEAMRGGKHVSQGVRPDLDLDAWTQPWSPLVLLWKVRWYPIAHDRAGETLWTFDGNDYIWGGEGFDGEAWEYQSMIYMTPQASFNFKSQLEKFLKENPDAARVEALGDFIAQTDGWDFLSQSLVGLSQFMTRRRPTPAVSPAVDAREYFPRRKLSDLVGSNATFTPDPGVREKPPFGEWPPSGFQDWRAGQFTILRLFVVDRFGQTCEVVNSQSTSKPVRSDALVPQVPVEKVDPDRFMQLPLRLLQPARLNFEFVSSSDDNSVLSFEPDINPVCAWLLHNYLDESLATYDSAGRALGSVWVATDGTGQQFVNWQPAPGSIYATVADLLEDPQLHHLGQCLSAVQQLGPSALVGLLAAMDESSRTINSSETTADLGLTLLAGRPVAMVRVQLQFELTGTAVSDPSWRFTFDPKPNRVVDWPFSIRLGEPRMTGDGLIGYFSGSDYTRLFVPSFIGKVKYNPYVIIIGALSLPLDGSKTWLTLLADPRAAVHATTGIVPVNTLTIPQTFVDAGTSRLEVTFNVGPLLTATVLPQDPTSADPATVVMPLPFLKEGVWSWQQLGDGSWQTFDVIPAVPTAQLSNVQPVLRDGLLRLTTGSGDPE